MIKDRIYDLLQHSMLGTAIELLMVHFNLCKSDARSEYNHKQLILLSGTYWNFVVAIQQNKISYDEFELEIFKLCDAFIHILEDIPCQYCEVEKKITQLEITPKGKKVLRKFIEINQLK
jgi:hypothetical protein